MTSEVLTEILVSVFICRRENSKNVTTKSGRPTRRRSPLLLITL